MPNNTETLYQITPGTSASEKAVILDKNSKINALDITTLTLNGTALAATAAELNNVADTSARLVAGGATLTLTQALHDGKTVLWDTAAGTILTLPAATGTGMRLRLVVSVLATSNNHSVACVGTDEFSGVIMQIDTDTSDAIAAYPADAADNFDTITFNRTTTGIAGPGDWVELEDTVTGVWTMRGMSRATGSVATPLTSAV